MIRKWKICFKPVQAYDDVLYRAYFLRYFNNL